MKNYVIVALIVASVCLADFNPAGEYQYLLYTVHTGDTVWSIAEKYADAQCKPFNEFTFEIQQHNRLAGRHIYPGDKLEIPLWVRVKEKNDSL